MKIAWAVASCRNLFQGSRRHVVAVALLTVAGCISFIGQSTGVHNIFHEATRRPIPFWEEESRLRMEQILDRDLPVGTAAANFVDYVTGVGGECLYEGAAESVQYADTYLCTYESYSYSELRKIGIEVLDEYFYQWLITVLSKDGVVLSYNTNVNISITRLERSEYIERLDAQIAAESFQ